MLILIATTGGNLYMTPDEHGPFDTIAICNDHAPQAIHDARNNFPQRTLFTHICIPFEAESV